ncbi:MAG: T9SS type A sorting domain-containing protein [Candidatus Cloacimonetes bacterium]|nr:T9SS type A sorting domain-containing protein [Candidatus Cloacimonadota bacterium]
MKLRHIILSLLIINSSLLITQDTWIQTYQPFGDVDYYPEDIVVCQDGGYAVNGYYYFYDPEELIEEWWGFLMKTDSDGNLLWAFTDEVDFMTMNESYAFVETTEGDFISIGYNYGSGYMIKRDSSGNTLWTIPYNGCGTNSMANTDDGNIILTGRADYNAALRKMNTEGESLWTVIYDLESSIAKSVVQSQDGGYLITGKTYLDDDDVLVIKTDANGDSLWTRTYDGYGLNDEGKSISEDINCNIMIAGEVKDPGITGFLWYLDEEGNTIWTQEVDENIGHSQYSVISIPDNQFVTYCYSGYGAYREATIYTFDNNFDIFWQSEFVSNVAIGDKTIRFINSEYFVLPVREVGGAYINNMGIIKTDSSGQVANADDYELQILDFKLSNYPNPFQSLTTISFSNLKRQAEAQVEIFNIKGQKIKTLNAVDLMFDNQVVWNAQNIPSGIYLYRIKTQNGFSKASKMILTK